jgi:hypothetical protein
MPAAEYFRAERTKSAPVHTGSQRCCAARTLHRG